MVLHVTNSRASVRGDKTMKNIAILAILFVPFMARGATYQWIDENGIRHFGDKSPPQVDKRRPNNTHNRRGVENKSAITTGVSTGNKTSEKPLAITTPRTQSTTPLSTYNGWQLRYFDNNNKALRNVGKGSRISTATTYNTKKVSVIQPAAREAAKNNKKLKAIALRNTKITHAPKPKQSQVMKKTNVYDGNRKNAELCIVFSEYVKEYLKKIRTCGRAVCRVYQSSLIRYQTRQRQHCS